MPILRRLPPVPTTAASLSHQHAHLVTRHPPLGTTPSSLPHTRLRIRPAPSIRPLFGIPSSRCHAAGGPVPYPVPVEDSARATLVRVGEALSLGFPVWVASACALALWRPATFLWVSPTAQMIGLSFTMLGMGMTLTLDDLRTALLMPKELAAGFVLQYSVMPLSGYFISKLLNLPSD